MPVSESRVYAVLYNGWMMNRCLSGWQMSSIAVFVIRHNGSRPFNATQESG